MERGPELTLLMLAHGFTGVHYTILSPFTYIQSFHNI